MKTGTLLSTILDLAEGMIVSGADTWQVEEAVRALMDTYCFKTSNVLVMSNCIYATAKTWDGRAYTEVRRIDGVSRDLDKLDRLFSLLREVHEKPVGMDKLAQKVNEILESPGNPPWRTMIGGAVAAGSFTLFFNGGILDAIASMLTTVIVITICKYAIQRQKNKLTPNTFAAFAMEAIIIALVLLGLCGKPGSVTLGGTMLLISSLGLTNGFKDLLHGDALSGLMDTANSIVGALGIAIGISLAMLTMPGSEQVHMEIMPLAESPAMQVLFIVVACVGFTMVFGARGRSIVYSAIGGGVTWIIYMMVYAYTGSVFESTFAGAIFVAAYAYIISRLTRIPETVFFTICVVPLLPGSYLYYTALGAVSRDLEMLASQGSLLFITCISISIGFLFVDVAHIYIDSIRRIIEGNKS